jgi:hypothetical protein
MPWLVRWAKRLLVKKEGLLPERPARSHGAQQTQKSFSTLGAGSPSRAAACSE